MKGHIHVHDDIELRWSCEHFYEDGTPVSVEFTILDRGVDTGGYVIADANGCINIGTAIDNVGHLFHACSWTFLHIFPVVQRIIHEIWPNGERQ